MASIVVEVHNLATRTATEDKAIRTLVNGNAANLSALTTTAKSNLVAALNEIKAAVDAAASSGGATNLDQLTDVTLGGVAQAEGHMLRRDGSGQYVNVDPTTYLQPRDSDLDAIATLATTAFGRGLLALADAAALQTAAGIVSASTTAAGIIEISTAAENTTGTDDTRAVSPLGMKTFAQPLDSDLTAIAALATTAYGRAFLALADQTAFMALVQSASETVQGKVELATNAETVTGTDTVRATHAAGTKAAIDARISNDNTLGGGSPSTTNAPSVAAAKAYIDALLAASNAMVFKGVIDASSNPNYPAASAGDVYRISVAGKIGGASGPNVEVGDQLLCLTDGTAAGNHATVGANWNITQVNVDGAVTGPASSVSGNLASFNGTGGKAVQDSGFTPSNAAIGAGSATVLPTSAQVVAYAQPIDPDLTAIAALVSAANKFPYATGVGTWALADVTAFARSILDDADAAAVRTTIDVYSKAEIGDIGNVDFVATFNAGLV